MTTDKLMRLTHAATMTEMLVSPIHVAAVMEPSVAYMGYDPKAAAPNVERTKAVVATTSGVYYGVTQTVEDVAKALNEAFAF